MAKFVEYVNNTPEYYEYLCSKVKNEDMAVESLPQEEIEILQSQETQQAQEIEELSAMIDSVE